MTRDFPLFPCLECGDPYIFVGAGRSHLLTSPGYPAELYPDNLSCRWVIETHPGRQLLLRFQEFKLRDTDGDYVEIVLDGSLAGSSGDGGGTRSYSSPVQRFTGRELPPLLLSKENSISVTMVTDEDYSDAGFVLLIRDTDGSGMLSLSYFASRFTSPLYE